MRHVSMSSLFRAFTWIGLTSLGGGRIAYLYEELVERRRWLTRDEFLPGFALSTLLPGPTVPNLSVFLGQGLRGWRGAVLALLGIVLPGVVSILGLSALYFHYGLGPDLNAVLRGMGAAVAGFLCVITEKMTRGAFRGHGLGGVLIAVATFLAVGVFRVNTFLVIFVMGALALCVYRPRPGAAEPPEAEAGR